MLKITAFAKTFEGKNGKFTRLTSKGKYLPLLDCNDEEFYTIRVHGVDAPKTEGEYDIGFESRHDIWLDKRPEAEDKNIVHVNAKKILFIKK